MPLAKTVWNFFMSFLGRDPGLIIFLDPVSEAIFCSISTRKRFYPREECFFEPHNNLFDPLGIILFDPLINFFLIRHPFLVGKLNRKQYRQLSFKDVSLQILATSPLREIPKMVVIARELPELYIYIGIYPDIDAAVC